MNNIQKCNVITKAEQNILAIAAHSISAAEKIFYILTDEDFTTINYRIIFKSLCDLFVNKVSIDITTLSNYMLRNNKLDQIGGIEFLTDLFQSYTTDAYLQEYLDIIINNTTSRKLKDVVERISNDIQSNQPIEEVICKAEKDILNINHERKSNIFKNSFDEVDKVLKKIEMLENSESVTTGSPSGFDDLDKITCGFQKGDFIILAARPSMGKTALALNFAFNCAERTSDAIVIFSVEMSSEQLIQRMIGTISTVDSYKVRNGKGLTDNDWKRLTKAAEQLKKIKLFIDDTPGLKILELQSKLRRLCRENTVSLVIIDYLQLLSTGGFYNNESRQQEVSMLSRQLKSLARELKVPIICLSQLSRSVEKREDKRPIMSDLRDSGAIEQDADVIMFLYREEYYTYLESGKNYDFNSINSEKAQLILSKHRNGPTGNISILFVKKYGLFSNYGII